MHKVMGWDIGGAHVKAVLLDDVGKVIQVQQIACPLWLGLEQLSTAILMILKNFNVVSHQLLHAITMTGELVDLFANRHEGVIEIAELVDQLLGPEVLFYCIKHDNNPHFVAIENVPENTKLIASANWHASACLLAKILPSALLIDIGSTTTDIMVIDDGKVTNHAMTDAERMQQDTLVYTGVVRTPVMAVAQKLQWEQQESNVAAEYFATMADVYRLTEELPAALDMAETADKGPKTMLASARRLARMVGYDVEDKPLASWQQLAQACRENQIKQIQSAAHKHLKRNMTVIGAGAGHFLVATIAQRLEQPYISLMTILNSKDDDLTVCLPAYAVASLVLKRDAV